MPLDFDQILGKIGAVFRPGAGPVEINPMLAAAQGWLFGVLQHGTTKWLPFMMQNLACAVPDVRGPCAQLAVAPCAICRLPTCLEHGLAAWNADIVCMRCMHTYAAMVQQGRARIPEPPPQHAHAPHGQAAPSEDPVKLRKLHLRTLGLKDPADLAEITAAYKELALKHHPDRHMSEPPAQQQKAAEKFRACTAAFTWLKNAESAQKAA
jgi:DnaJ-like protein